VGPVTHVVNLVRQFHNTSVTLMSEALQVRVA
jgi:hypothetical protein